MNPTLDLIAGEATSIVALAIANRPKFDAVAEAHAPFASIIPPECTETSHV